MTTRKIIERVSARVFCHLEHGGNPVTIFSSASPLTLSAQERLAKDCTWESVMVHRGKIDGELPQLSFYMPSGEQVSFCAHAAMGAALELSLDDPDNDEISFTIAKLKAASDNATTIEEDEKRFDSIIYDADIVALNMETLYEQTDISQPSLLYRMLREYLRVEVGDLATIFGNNEKSSSSSVPSFEQIHPKSTVCHASIARPKTLVPVTSVDILHNKAHAPKPTSSKGFELSCKALDDTTGVYMYAKSEEEDGAWECRQFPRSSGYPEDPATGIAAGALACHLYHHLDIDLPAYKMYQGTAMGKPSLIVVDELEMKREETGDNEEDGPIHAKFRLLGRVEIDERETMEITDDEL
jgi:predicted PhzF superfamily epimerase YddE/YHI9